MSESVSIIRTKIVRTVEMSFRRTLTAHFQTPEGYFIADAWFDEGEPRMQIRSSAHSLEEAAIVQAGIGMAVDWMVEETARGGNVPATKKPPEVTP